MNNHRSNTPRDFSVHIAVAVIIGLVALLIISSIQNGNNKTTNYSTNSNDCRYSYDKVTGEYHEMECENDYGYLDDPLYDDYDSRSAEGDYMYDNYGYLDYE